MNTKYTLLILINFFINIAHGAYADDAIQSTTNIIQTTHARIWSQTFFTQNSKDKTPILCLHGGPGFPHHCMLDLQALATDRPVIFYDQSGCGNSEFPEINDQYQNPDHWTFPFYLQELEDIIDILGYEQVILLGFSWGGTLALQYASIHQNKVAGLILASPMISAAQWIVDCKNLAASISPDFLQLIEKHETAGTTSDQQYQDAVELFSDNFACRIQPWPTNIIDSCQAMSTDVYFHMWGPSEFTVTGNLQNVDLTENLSTITIPTLLTCGRYDTATPETMQYYADILPNGAVAILEQSGHMNMAEEPEAYCAHIRDFLATNNI